MMKKKKRKRAKGIQHDERGQFRWEIYFVGGKQKRRKVRLVEGMETEEFIARNADDVWLHQHGYHEVLHAREVARKEQEEDRPPDDHVQPGPGPDGDEEDVDIPF